MFANCTPIFPVRDVIATQQYFQEVLGFTVDWIWDDDFGSVSRDRVCLFFSKETKIGEGLGSFWSIDKVDAVYTEYQKSGAKITRKLENKPWGMREFTIEDLNGHSHRIGSELPEN
ncbi:MAG: VOC family protein [Cyanobacteria bacterium P01_E01_bin.42]